MSQQKTKPLSRTQLQQLYKQMRLMRFFEEKLSQFSQEGVLRGSLHLARGQEALPAGACAALKKDDYITVTYRGHGYVLAKGCDMGRVIAEILGRQDGLCKGKGGKMHLTDIENGLLGANGIVGGGVPIAAGGALSAMLSGTGQVAMTVFGDGTLNQGVTHETLNMAGLFKLPMIFLCENNLYAEMTPLDKSTAVTNLTDRMAAYGIPAVKIDGNDVLAVYEAVSAAVAKARAGGGSTFIEAMTYRTCGHYHLDPGFGYRTKEEVAQWEAKNPIDRFERYLLEHAEATGEDIERLTAEAKKEVEDAAAFALKSPEPTPDQLKEDLFV